MARVTEYITITDFRPGIFAEYTSARGAATVENTYRCGADVGGALVPLPALTATATSELIPGGNAAAHHPPGEVVSMLIDAWVREGVKPTSGTINDDRRDVFHLYAFKWDSDQPNDTYRQYAVVRVNYEWENDTPTQRDLTFGRSIDGDTSTDTPWLSGNFAGITTTQLLAGGVTSPLATNNINAVAWLIEAPRVGQTGTSGEWDSELINANDLAITTFDTITDRYTTALSGGLVNDPVTLGGGAAGGIGASYPSHWSASTGDADHVPAFMRGAGYYRYPRMCTSHQSRLVAISTDDFNAGSGAVHERTYLSSSRFSNPWDFLGSLLYVPQLYVGEDNPARIECIASISANKLLVINGSDGGYLVEGDIFGNPSIVRLPFLESTYGVYVMAVNTPIGLVYGGRRGIYAWDGGPNSEHLSPQLPGFFWDHATDDATAVYQGVRGRLAWWHPYVCVPNNFLYDIRHRSWWRIDLPANTGAAFNVYCVGELSGTLHAFPYKLTATQNNQRYEGEQGVLASSYSWQSQPLIQATRERQMSVHEVRLLAANASASDTATVTVTLTGHDQGGTPHTSVSTVFTLAANQSQPQTLSKDVAPNVNAAYVQVQIEATVSEGPAPTIHRLSIGVAEGARLARP